jgi:ubiquinone/menaquinone biosynthesis C-methylase UbiE
MITTDEAARKLWNRAYQLKATTTLWGEPPVPWVEWAVERYKADRAETVLDAPCGDGRNVLRIATAVPFVVGADASPNALALAQRKLAATNARNVVLQRADLFAMDFVSDQFDGVFCCDVLGHLVRAPEALHELVRVCRPGKCVVGNFFALEDTTRGKEMERICGEEYRYQDGFYFRFRDRTEVAALLEQLPAETLSIELAKWTEPPHEGYREYTHEHASWVFVVRKLPGRA